MDNREKTIAAVPTKGPKQRTAAQELRVSFSLLGCSLIQAVCKQYRGWSIGKMCITKAFLNLTLMLRLQWAYLSTWSFREGVSNSEETSTLGSPCLATIHGHGLSSTKPPLFLALHPSSAEGSATLFHASRLRVGRLGAQSKAGQVGTEDPCHEVECALMCFSGSFLRTKTVWPGVFQN